MKAIIVGFIVLFLWGCTTPPKNKISEIDRNKISLIQIGSITVNDQIYYSGPVSVRTAGAVFLDGLAEFSNKLSVINPFIQFASVPFAVGAEFLRQLEVAEFQLFVKKSDITINEIIRNELTTQLQQTNNIQLVEAYNEHLSSTTLQVDVVQYGFKNERFTSNLKPVLSLTARLVDKDGKKFWENSYSYINKTEPVFAIPYNDLLNNSQRIKSLWYLAARDLISDITNDLAR